ncbi:MAG: winged helix-turn-helix domain-containing protein [Rhodothermales bacterium]
MLPTVFALSSSLPLETSNSHSIDLHERFWIGDWEVDPWRNRLLRDGEPLYLEPKVMQVLLCLAQNAEEPVPRDVLLDTVWVDSIVEETTLRRTISQLRKALNDSAQHPRYIETIARVGYRLMLPVTFPSTGDTHTAPLRDLTLSPIAAPAPLWPTRTQGVLAALLLSMLGFLIWHISRTPPSSSLPQQTVLTTLSGQELAPAFSPDGAYVAFVHLDAATGASRLYRTEPNAAPVALTDGTDYISTPAWSPDGTQIAFVARTPERCTVRILTIASTQTASLTPCYASSQAARWSLGLSWSPDGQWLATADTVGGTMGLVQYHTREDLRQVLTMPDVGTWDEHPRFSPDGTQIAFTRQQRHGRHRLHVLSLTDGQVRALGAAPVMTAGFDWMPDGKALLASAKRDSRFRLWMVPLSGEAATWLSAMGTLDPGALSISQATQEIVYEEWAMTMNIWQQPLEGDSPARQVITSMQADHHPTLSPDGTRMAFVSNRSGPDALWLAEADGTENQSVVTLSAIRHPQWSPDGTHIAFTAHADQQDRVHLFTVATGVVRPVTTGAFDSAWPTWSADGSALYYASNQQGTWNIWAHTISTGAATPRTRWGGHRAIEGPDQMLYYTKPSGGLWRSAPDADTETLLTADLAPDDEANWALSSSGIYFLSRTQGVTALQHFSFATERITQIRHPFAPLTQVFSGLIISPDERHIWYAQLDLAESELVQAPLP